MRSNRVEVEVEVEVEVAWTQRRRGELDPG